MSFQTLIYFPRREKRKIYSQCHQFCLVIFLSLAQNQCCVLTDVTKRWQDSRLALCNACIYIPALWQSRPAYYLTLVSLSKLIPLRCNPSPVICHLLFILFPSPHYVASFPSLVLLDLSPLIPQLWCLSTLPTTTRSFTRLTYYSFRKILSPAGGSFCEISASDMKTASCCSWYSKCKPVEACQNIIFFLLKISNRNHYSIWRKYLKTNLSPVLSFCGLMSRRP